MSIMILVTTLLHHQVKTSSRNFPAAPSFFTRLLKVLHFTLFLIQIQNPKCVLCQLDSNINTLRYDGEVNIGKKIQIQIQ
jgi:hypothetical protein